MYNARTLTVTWALYGDRRYTCDVDCAALRHGIVPCGYPTLAAFLSLRLGRDIYILRARAPSFPFSSALRVGYL